MKTYAIRITDIYGSGEVHVRAANKAQARKEAQLYIRQWHLQNATIDSIQEV